MSTVSQIVKGFYNNIVNKEEDLFQSRIEICRKCKLHKDDPVFGEACNSNLYLNPVTDETSKTPKIGFYNGCGCILASKCRVPEAECPLKR